MGIQTETPWDPAGFWDAINEIRKLAGEVRPSSSPTSVVSSACGHGAERRALAGQRFGCPLPGVDG